MAAQPSTPPPSTVPPWLAQPLPPLLWLALALAAIVFLAAVIRVRRSDDRFPVSPRWLTIAAILCCAFFAALSYGANLAHPAALYITPVLILISALLARSAWHAPDDQQARVTTGSLAAASVFTTASLLLLFRYGTRWDMGLGVGEAMAFFLPALGTALTPLAFLPASHSRTPAARRAVVLFVGLLAIGLAGTVAATVVATTTPLPYESPLAARYSYFNTLVAIPSILTTLCVLGTLPAVFTKRPLLKAAGVLLIAAATFPVFAFMVDTQAARQTFDFVWWHPAACLAAGVVIALLLALSSRPWRQFRIFVPAIVLFTLCILVGAIVPGKSVPILTFENFCNTCSVLTGLFVAGAVSSNWPPSPSAESNGSHASSLPADYLLIGLLLAFTLTIRSQLTFQAVRQGQTFKFEKLPNTNEEMRRELQMHPYALHIGCDRWAWALPDAVPWTLHDSAWRDALIVVNHAQPRLEDSPMTGPYYGVRITAPDFTPSDDSFTEARNVDVIQPVRTGTGKSAIVHTVPARQATIEDLRTWARLNLSNPRLWLGFLLGIPFGWWHIRRARAVGAAVCMSTIVLLAAACVLGLAGATALLACACMCATFSAARPDDQWRSSLTVVTLGGTALGLCGLLIRLNDLL